MKNYVQALIDGPLPRRRRRRLLDARRRPVVRVPAVQGPGHAHRPQSAAGLPPGPGDQAGPARGQDPPADRDPLPGLRRRARAAHAPAAGGFRLPDLRGHVLSRSRAATSTTSTIPTARATPATSSSSTAGRATRTGTTAARSCIGEYYNVSRYKCLPICFMHTMAHDIPYYYQAGARHFHYMHVTTGHWGNKSLTNYQMARQLWDVDTDCEALWKDISPGVTARPPTSCGASTSRWSKMLSNVEPLKGWSSNLASRLDAGRSELFPDAAPALPARAGRDVRRADAGGDGRARQDVPPADRPGAGHAAARADQGPDRRGRADVHLRRADAGLLRRVRQAFQLAGPGSATRPGGTMPRPSGWPSCCGPTPRRQPCRPPTPMPPTPLSPANAPVALAKLAQLLKR